MTWIASCQGNGLSEPKNDYEFLTEADAQGYADRHNRATGHPVTVWELGDEEGLG